MIILDTNVVSALMGPTDDPRIANWLADSDGSELYITTVTRAGVRYGIARLPSGRRRERIATAADGLFTRLSARTLNFTAEAADAYGNIVASRERQGRPIGIADTLIAAIALVHGATVATRDRGGFEQTGVDVVDPFATSAQD